MGGRGCVQEEVNIDSLGWEHVNAVPEPTSLPPPPLHPKMEDEPSFQELAELKESLADTQPAGTLVSQCVTLDQATVLLKFIEAISEKTLRSTVTLTAARGRGKSATMGMSMAAAVAYGCVGWTPTLRGQADGRLHAARLVPVNRSDTSFLCFFPILSPFLGHRNFPSYSNIFVTSPSPENLKTLFDFVFKGFDALNYQVGAACRASLPTTVSSPSPSQTRLIRIACSGARRLRDYPVGQPRL